MKNIFKIIVTLFFILNFVPTSYPQGNNYNFTNANISFTYPENWIISEHILLLLMPKAEDLKIQFQISSQTDLSAAVKESMNELKALYPDDSLLSLKDITINKLKVKEVEGTVQDLKIHYLLIEVPGKKIIKVSYFSPEDVAVKYNSDIRKILYSIKPLD